MSKTSERTANRLAHETSPYLLQHAHNPVDWYPWGPEAFEAARRLDKPIFLSVGYSTCYWCHVMERQCFENESIATLMNELFINIKVDREERPDVDQLYMTAVQVLTRHGGWPMSVFLLPDLRPFWGGTYFPPEDMHGRPGFPTVLRQLSDACKARRTEVEDAAAQLVSILRQLAEPRPPARTIELDLEAISKLVDRSVADFEPQFGGFGSAPKFPRETLLELLLAHCAQDAAGRDATSQNVRLKSLLGMLRQTLDAMANGGIRDHLGGGFHRYSTDERWLVPHFEIMLYDNAMLGWCYVEAYRQTEEPRYARIARGVLDFVLREMTSPEGGFYTAFDAEVDAQEGLTYLWTRDEVERVLGKDDAEDFGRVYGLDRGPNFADPHHGSGVPDKNILYLPHGPQREDDPRIVAMRQKLYDARRQRKQPLLDTKIITSWNALMIRCLAYAGKVLQEERYLSAAQRAAEFVLARHRTADGGLYRTSRDGTPKYDAFLDDYAFLGQALLELHHAGAEQQWRERAAEIATVMRQRFGDDAGGFYFTAASARDLIVRQMVGSDSPLPSGNAVAAMVLNELGETEPARRTIERLVPQFEVNAEGMSAMLQAALLHVRQHGPIVVEADPSQQRQGHPLSPQQLASGAVAVSAGWHDPQLLELRLDVLEPFHINANRASHGLIPTDVRPIGDDVEVVAIEYPPGELRAFAFTDEPINVYAGRVRILVRFASSRSGTPPVKLALQYQACDDNACLPPLTKHLEIPTP